MASKTKIAKPRQNPQGRDDKLLQYQGEMSDEDSPCTSWEGTDTHEPSLSYRGIRVGRSPISSKSQGSAVQREEKKSDAQDITSIEFWTDKKFLVQIIIFGILQSFMTWVVHRSLQGSITNLKACSRSSSNTEESLRCSDCMCIATDGFSSGEFRNIIKNQEALSKEFKQKTKELEDMENKLAGIETKVSEFTGLHDIKETLQEIDTEIKVMPENLHSNITSSLEELIDNRVKDRLDSIENNMGEKIKSEVQEKSTSLENKLQDIQERITVSERNMGQLIKDERRERTAKFNEVEETVNNIKESASKNFTEVESKYKGVEGQLNYFFRELKDINIYIVGFLLVLVVVVIYVAYKILLPKSPSGEDGIRQVTQIHDPLPRSRVGGQSPPVNIERITKRSLDRSIGIISFNTSTQQFHQDLMSKVSKPRSLDLLSSFIHRSNDIPHTTPSKVVFIFVDFNERNIILEDPETEIGDIRRLTTQGLLNMGCDVFVVYVRDRGSENLRPNQLYNPQLYSIERHPILSKLKERDRVLSVYNSFLPHQVKFLEDCLKRL
ncbi:uncharacterized protein LOC133174199 [Saccostrea echinata]|uniref:uncharacterized protein LOC133174199 n=1 Tax=Saccostrea echinata TaxID=191078 RepID=UPI002A823608|nr:uncharacterized protein LOC133174199 [Saccostrea echinata]